MNTKQLRQKILDLAIRGKLVPQDPTDEPASILLERIATEKARLVKEGKIKADKKAKASPSSSDKSHYPLLRRRPFPACRA
jgi:type I restriction enzyme S subunit